MAAERPSLRRALVALEYRDFRLYYIALVVARVGEQLQATATMWQVYELTSSPLHLGLTGLARGIPIIVLSLIGGVIADRVDRRRFIIVSQGIVGALALALAALTATNLVDVWHIYAVILVSSALNAISAPARQAIIPNLVPREHLLNAIALNSTVWQISNIVGPALGGVSIALFGLPVTYAVNGLLHLITLGALVGMHLGVMPPRPRESPLRSFLDGFAFVRYQSIILVLLAMDSAATFFGAYRTVLPVFARDLGVGADGLGLLLAMPAIGGMLGATVIMSLGDVRYKGVLVTVGILAYCAALVLLALSPWFYLSLLATLLLGMFDSTQATPRNALIQAITPDELRGRVSSLQTMLTNGVPSMGQTQVGAVAAIIGAPLTVIVGAVACAAVVLGIAAKRKDLWDPNLGATPKGSYPGP
jgi:MFS family permease